MRANVDREKQEKEVMEYLIRELDLTQRERALVSIIVRRIMRRYDLFDTDDMSKEDEG